MRHGCLCHVKGCVTTTTTVVVVMKGKKSKRKGQKKVLLETVFESQSKLNKKRKSQAEVAHQMHYHSLRNINSI
jgi:hypothetical protein